MPRVVYIYGPAATGKTRLINEIFHRTTGTVVMNDKKFSFIDYYSQSISPYMLRLVHPNYDYLIVTSNNVPSTAFPLHLDHVFRLDNAASIREVRSFLNSIVWA